jgi:hypothetical protein
LLFFLNFLLLEYIYNEVVNLFTEIIYIFIYVCYSGFFRSMWTTADPGADLVGLSILGVVTEKDNDSKQQASLLRRKAAAVTSRVTAPEAVSVSHSAPLKDSISNSPAAVDDSNKEPPLQIVWRNVLIFVYLHAAALYGFYLCFAAAKLATLSWCKLI